MTATAAKGWSFCQKEQIIAPALGSRGLAGFQSEYAAVIDWIGAKTIKESTWMRWRETTSM
jgi:hypothetical protein